MQKNGRKTGRKKNPMLFCFLAALLIVLIIIFAFLSMDSENRYRTQAAIQPSPSPTVRPVAVTHDPYLVTYAPLPSPTPAYLSNGSEGEMVWQLQTRLQALGYYQGGIDGQYGNGTRDAVMLFQRQHGLAADGVAGQQTLSLLYSDQAQYYRPVATATPAPVQPVITQAPMMQNTPAPVARQTEAVPTPMVSLMAYGSDNESVRYLQQRLLQLGFYQGAVDGQFGKGTKEAVELFQKQHGLEADGAAGAKTIGVLWSDQAKYVVVTPKPTPVTVTGQNILILVNRDHQLPEEFEPADLVRIKDIAGSNMLYADSDVQGVREAVVALNEMITAAKADGISPWKIREGYRTLKDQKAIFDNYVNKFMNDGQSRSSAVSSTRLTVADPGCSEHHTGLAFDLNANNPDLAFVDTAQYVWLYKNCWDYGFIIRYTDEKEEITGFMGEEWHVRYVGKEHSKKMKDMGLCLEEYLDYLNAQ